MTALQSNVSLVEIYQKAWQSSQWAARIALVHEECTVRYGELAARVGDMATSLREQGVAHGDLVAIAMERSLDMVLVILGALWAGACPCPLEPGLSQADIDARIAAAGIDVLIYDAGSADSAKGQPVQLIPFERLRHGVIGHDNAAIELAPHDPALLLFTSGSTGRPKGVLLSHGNLLSNTAGLVAHDAICPDDRLLHMMPLHHTNGLNNQLFTPLAIGASVILGARFKAEAVPDLLERHRPTIMTGVPTMYARMLSQEFSPGGLAGLRMARCGSAPMPVELHREIEAKLGCRLIVSYGLSEATCTSTMNPPTRARIGSVGTVLSGQSVRLVDPASGREVEAGQEGEICIGGASVMLGYVGSDLDDAGRGVKDGWLRTGDLGRFDADGYLYVTGRIKDVIIRGGENLSPQVIENVINVHAGVATSCVVGRPDSDLGEVPVAFVVRRADAVVHPDDIAALVRAKLPRSCQLQAIIFVDQLPESSIGKIDRKSLGLQAKSLPQPQLSS
ncbi:MAG: class I adenylate-forming enzyme family protein [Xanthobacteraceae bacterium]